jgi:hypothetical protein
VVDGVEKATDVGIEHPVHLLPTDSDAECVQRMVRAASWPKSVGETEEVCLVDAVQDRHEGTLDYLVLERGDPERSLSPIRLRNEHPPDRLRPVRSTSQSSGEVQYEAELIFGPTGKKRMKSAAVEMADLSRDSLADRGASVAAGPQC